MLRIHHAGDRFVTQHEPGVVSHHSFSFGAHYDPTNVGFGLLVCHNEDELAPHHGYADHPHRDLEIVTWVLEGELHHRDSTGTSGVVTPGTIQRMSAGSGVIHQEYAGPGATRFVQMWLQPADYGLTPSYASAEVELGADWTPLIGGDGAIGLNNTATLHHLSLDGSTDVGVPPDLHLFVIEGSMRVAGQELAVGSALRADEEIEVSGEGRALVWRFR